MSKRETELALLVWARMIRIAQKMSRVGTEKLKEHGLTPAQFDLLRRIYLKDNQSQQELVEQLDVTRGNISQLISKLEADRLVIRIPQGGVNYLKLTEEGQALVMALVPEHDRFISERFAALTSEEQERLLQLVKKLDRSLS